MIALKKFNDPGLARVKKTLFEIRAKGKNISQSQLEEVRRLLEDEALLVEPSKAENLEPAVIFETAHDAGRYYYELVKELDNKDLRANGLWTWLCIFHLENFLQPAKGGEFILGSWDKYVLDIDDYRTYYRHPVYFPYLIYSRFGEGKTAQMFLNKKPYISGALVEEIASRQFVFSNDTLLNTISEKIYKPEASKPFHSEFLSKNRNHPANVSFMAQVWERQIGMNYDLFECDKDQIFELLPTKLIEASNAHH